MSRRAIVVGASSGIGRELARQLVAAGWTVGITGRRVARLEELAGTKPESFRVRAMDLSDAETAAAELRALDAALGGADLVIISSGTGEINPGLDWAPEAATIAVNVTGFAAVAGEALRLFLARGRGHLVGISSISALRGGADAPAYGASKAFVSNYLEALRCRARHSGKPVLVTDVLPGFVDTAMAKGEGLFWVASPEKAARQILAAVARRRRRVYVTRRWRLVALLLRFLPDSLYERLGGAG